VHHLRIEFFAGLFARRADSDLDRKRCRSISRARNKTKEREMVSKARSDSVYVRVQKVHYDVIGNELQTSTSGFQIVEADDPVPEAAANQPYHIAVEFDSSAPQAVVIDALRAIQKTIESHGLPEVVIKTPRRAATLLLKAQRELIKVWDQLEKAPPELRASFERMLQLQPTNSITEQQGPSFRISNAVDEIETVKQRER
jgi:hypothetical protein